MVVLVTGSTGFLGGQLVKEALARGHSVRAVVRTEASFRNVADQFPQFASKLSHAVVPDLTKPESFQGVFEDVTGVIHAASPFNLEPKNNEEDLLKPAIQASVAILDAALRYGKDVKRVVVTSSHASVVDITKGKRAGYVYSEKDWNPITYEEAADPSTDGVTAYCASKALAERAVWKWAEEHPDAPFDVVTITPPWIFGPYATELTSTAHISESIHLIYNLLGAKEVPKFDFGGYADVREVSAAHILALEVPAAGGQRFWVGQPLRWQTVVDIGREEFPELRSRLPVGNPGWMEDAYGVDGSKAEKVLGLKYLTMRDTIKDTFAQLLSAERAEMAAA
ncbi:NAD(P)-binding protein [Trichoderma longibrachiatum]|uniref:NAD(P)-binding protein n=1 Tax=Trichoderma longibrachiatum ATCC 18648 TaxID=983965 RepID=A0A2T4CIK5_TRILO|nr:NAD(P)-binding protein [Trichoderma longibrachiatum ATCC 18648]